jgi:hypothetical protein
MTQYSLNSTTEQQKSLRAILDYHSFDFIDAFEIEAWHEEGEDVQDEIQSRINEQDIVYYSTAIEYLAENDPSLMESLELARDAEYETGKLNSELLTTLLYQKNLSEKLCALLKDIDSFEFQETQEVQS